MIRPSGATRRKSGKQRHHVGSVEIHQEATHEHAVERAAELGGSCIAEHELDVLPRRPHAGWPPPASPHSHRCRRRARRVRRTVRSTLRHRNRRRALPNPAQIREPPVDHCLLERQSDERRSWAADPARGPCRRPIRRAQPRGPSRHALPRRRDRAPHSMAPASAATLALDRSEPSRTPADLRTVNERCHRDELLDKGDGSSAEDLSSFGATRLKLFLQRPVVLLRSRRPCGRQQT